MLDNTDGGFVSYNQATHFAVWLCVCLFCLCLSFCFNFRNYCGGELTLQHERRGDLVMIQRERERAFQIKLLSPKVASPGMKLPLEPVGSCLLKGGEHIGKGLDSLLLHLVVPVLWSANAHHRCCLHLKTHIHRLTCVECLV